MRPKCCCRVAISGGGPLRHRCTMLQSAEVAGTDVPMRLRDSFGLDDHCSDDISSNWVVLSLYEALTSAAREKNCLSCTVPEQQSCWRAVLCFSCCCTAHCEILTSPSLHGVPHISPSAGDAHIQGVPPHPPGQVGGKPQGAILTRAARHVR